MDIGLPGPKEQLWKLLMSATSGLLLEKALSYERSEEGIRALHNDIKKDLEVFAKKISNLINLPDPIDEHYWDSFSLVKDTDDRNINNDEFLNSSEIKIIKP
jgi:hypothetical protein